jgi:hypothetical protein
MGGDRGLLLKPFLHSVDKAETTLFVVLILVVRHRLLLQIVVILRWSVFVLLGNTRYIHLVLSLVVRVKVSQVSIRAGSPRLALIEAAVAVTAIVIVVRQR